MDWEVIKEFDEYMINQKGQVKNQHGRLLALTRNNRGLIQVGLMKDNVQHKRMVGLLVAKAFLDPPTPETFDTVINLDGDRSNNNLYNLMWRPRWFAMQYHKQFRLPRRGFGERIYEMQSKEEFQSSWEAAIKYGLLENEIIMSVVNRTYVWPTYQEFRILVK